MTNREAFYKVWDYFITKGNPKSTIELGACLYRGPNGTRCAIGVLIPDELYRPWFEGTQIQSILPLVDELKANFSEVDIHLLQAMQSAHDDSNPDNFTIEMRNRMSIIAIFFDLEVPNDREDTEAAPLHVQGSVH